MLMGFAGEFLIALIISVLLVFVLGALGRRGPWRWALAGFLILFLFTWMGGVWVGPYGPELMGVTWVPFLFFGLVMALIIAAAAPPRDRERAANPERSDDYEFRDEGMGLAVGAFFWLAIVGMVVALGVYYI